jgi:hypothetical protein
MTWHEDLRTIEWNGGKFTVLDKIKEEGRTYLGLAPFEDVAKVAAARDASQPQSLPTHLIWVEESSDGFTLLPRKAVDQILKRKADRAVEAFRKK